MKNKAFWYFAACMVLSLAAGIAAPLAMTRLGAAEADPTVGAAYATVLGLLLVVAAVEIVSVFKIDDSTFHTALMAGCLFALYALSADMQSFLSGFGVRVPLYALGIPSEFAYALAEGCCCWYILYLYRIPVSGKTAAFAAAPLSAALLGYSFAAMFGYGYIFHFILTAGLAVIFGLILLRAGKTRKVGFTTWAVALIFALAGGAQTVNALCYGGQSACVQGVTFAFSVLTFAAFVAVYLVFSVRTDIRAVQSDEYRMQAESFETRALAGQIKPHFIFNSLEAVRSLYHTDLALGDEAVTRLSDYLRASVRAFDSELVPFETEIENVYNYTEFENLKRKDKIEVIFDVDETDFCVPPFSIQPFIENAFRYSGVEKIEGGRIVISSFSENGRAVVEISDNGKGFDPSKIGDNSHGIRNARGRLALALGALTEVKSGAWGTKIRIEIKKEVKDEDRSHRR